MLVTYVDRVFKFGGTVNILGSLKPMQRFLEAGATEETRSAWEEKTDCDWEESYEAVSKALSVIPPGETSTRRKLLHSSGIYNALSYHYNIDARPPSVDVSSLRDSSDPEYLSRMASYSTHLTEAISNNIVKSQVEEVPNTWQAQIAQKVAFMTFYRPGGPMPRPFFCLQYIEDFVEEWARLLRALKEVRLSPYPEKWHKSESADLRRFRRFAPSLTLFSNSSVAGLTASSTTPSPPTTSGTRAISLRR